jgi:hypothetical protein
MSVKTFPQFTACLLGAGLMFGAAAWAQAPAGAPPAAAAAPAPGGPPGRPPPPANARAGAPADLTGQWVSVVTEDWRWRMITPPKGDYASVPLNAEGRKVADGWNLAADNAAGQQCRAFGVGGVTRMPGRLRISWQDDNTLKIETDAGQQTRLLRFVQPAPGDLAVALQRPWAPAGEPSWQGETKAQWFKQVQRRGLGFGGAPGPGGALRAVTRNMRPGYLRKNGVPYSEEAIITEQYNLHREENGDTWITITTIVDDPKYLSTPFITSTSFKKETDLSKWNPTPCQTEEPLEKPVTKAQG